MGAEDMELTEAEICILKDLLRNGDNIPVGLASNCDLHSKSVSRSLSGSGGLVEAGLADNKGHGVYTLTEAGEKRARELIQD